MLETLLPYYEKELHQMQSLASAFGKRYPKIAGRLLIDGDQIEDPHVRRIIESFSFIAARIHRRLDEDFSELSQALLEVLYPLATRPFPSATIVQFEPDWKKPEITEPYVITRGETVVSNEIDGQRCKFRTSYDVRILPLVTPVVSLVHAQTSSILGVISPRSTFAIKIDIAPLGATQLHQIDLQALRFFIDCEPVVANYVYQILFKQLNEIVVVAANGQQVIQRLDKSALGSVGFSAEESLRPNIKNSYQAFNLVNEYFVLPEKFLFFSVGTQSNPLPKISDDGASLYLCFNHVIPPELTARMNALNDKSWLRLNCTPIINQFQQAPDPIKLDHRQLSHALTVNGKQSTHFEIVNVESVTYVSRSENGTSHAIVSPLYGVGTSTAPSEGLFWHTQRQQSIRADDEGTELELFVVDRTLTKARPNSEVLILEAQCCNRDLPSRLPFGGSDGAFHTDFHTPKHGVVKRTRLLRKPTATFRPKTDKQVFWRLVSQLSLNYLSLVDNGTTALKEVLNLQDWRQSLVTKNQIDGIRSIRSEHEYQRIGSLMQGALVRGTKITVELDESAFVGAGWFLFGQILSRFFCLYAPINTFTRLQISHTNKEGIVHAWTAQNGDRPLI